MSLVGRRILFLAPYANPEGVGEARSTFGWLRHLAHRVDGIALVHGDPWPAVRDRLQDTRVQVHGWPEPRLFHQLGRVNRMLKPGLVVFARNVRAWLREEGSRHRFDIVHQLAPLSLRFACPARGLRGTKLVVGPVAGSLPGPPSLIDEIREPWWARLRRFDAARMRLDPRLRRTYQHADLVLGAGGYVKDLLPPDRRGRFEVMSEVGLEEPLPERAHRRTSDGGVSLLFVGRLVGTKGIFELVEAARLLGTSHPFRLDIVGDGPERQALETRVRELGLTERVVLRGRVSREGVDEFYRNADIFVFPSFREPSGNVVIEAMSWGLPLIVADYGGPAQNVTPECGVKVPVDSREGFISGLAAAIADLIRDPSRRDQLGRNARERAANHFVWEKKARQMVQWYEELLSKPANPA